jgi:hypothetical protein
MVTTPEEFELLFPHYQDEDNSLQEHLENLPPNLQAKARLMKSAKQLQHMRTTAVHLVSQQMEVLLVFLTEASKTERKEPRVKSICVEILRLLKVWDAFRYHTHETCYYRWAFREQSVKGIRRLKACLRNEVKLAFRVENGSSSFAEELKLLVAAIQEMQLHAKDMPFEGPPPLSQRVDSSVRNARFFWSLQLN